MQGQRVKDALAAKKASGKPYLKLANSAILLILNYSNAAVSLPQAISDRDWDFLAATLGITLLLCVVAFLAGWPRSSATRT